MKLFSSVHAHGLTCSPKNLSIAIAIIAATGLSSLVVAQERASGFSLEEVVVTARKREESIQEVPVAVSAFSTESLKSLGVTNIKDLDGIVPGLNMGGGGNGIKGDSNPYIRGIGQRETKVTIDSAVGTYLDGIYVGRASGALLDAVDVASIQVLRGPQGTLFGKNTTGGALVINTAKPDPDFGGHFDVTMGNFGRRNASMAINTPLIDDKLYARLTLGSTKNDGIIENQLDGISWSDDDRAMAIGQLRWDFSDAVQADFLLSTTKTRQNSRGQKCKFLGAELEAVGFLVNPDTGVVNKPTLESIYDGVVDISAEERCNESGRDLPIDEFYSELGPGSDVFGQSVYEVDTHMFASTISWDLEAFAGFEGVVVKSITGLRRTELKADEDLDGGRAGLTGRVAPTDNATDQYTQEFQFVGSAMDGRLNATLGLYAFLEQTDGDWLQTYAGFASDAETTAANSILLAQSQLTERETDNRAVAAFAQFDYDLTEYIEVTLGLRYTEEERTTTYHESNVYLPSIGNGVFCPNPSPGVTCPTFPNGTTLHLFSEPGTRPFNEWVYGYDADNSGSLELDEIGKFGADEDDRSDSDWTPSLSVKFLATESIMETFNLDEGMLFLTYSEGFRSGGVIVSNGDFNGDGIKDLENFEPEFVVNYEIGLKLDAFDRKLRANLAAFYTEYTDIQVTTTALDPIGVPLPSIENAGEARIEGAEAEFTLIPTEAVRITASVAYTNGDYEEYLVDAENLVGDLVETDRSDEPMPRIAEWTAFLAVDYFIFTESMGTFIPSISARYTTELYQGFDRASFLIREDLTSPEIHFLDARLTWQAPDDRTTVTLWGKNLSNEDDYATGGVPLVSVNRSSGLIYAEPRTYGIDISYTFGE